MMVYICTKFHENILNGIRVMVRTRKVNGRTDGRPDRRTDRRPDGRRLRHNTTRLQRAYKNVSNGTSLPQGDNFTVKNIRRFYDKITGNQLPVHSRYFYRCPVNTFRNQAQNGSKGHYCFFFFFCHTAQQSYIGIFKYCRLT